MEPVLLVALLSVVAVDLPPPVMMVSVPYCDKNVCTLEVPVVAKIRHPAVKATVAAARRSVGIAARLDKSASKSVSTPTKLKSARRTTKKAACIRHACLVAKGVRLICPKRQCCRGH